MSLSTQLKRLRSHLFVQSALTGAFALVTCISCAVAALYAIDRVFHPGPGGMAFFGLAGVVAVTGLTIWLVVLPLFQRRSLRRLALMVESNQPEVMDRFSTAMYLDAHADRVERLGFSPALVEETRRWAEDKSARYLDNPIAWNQIRRLGTIAGLCLLGVAALGIIDRQSFLGFANRLGASLSADKTALQEVAFRIPPESVVPRGEKGALEFNVLGDFAPGSVEVLAQQGASTWLSLKPQPLDRDRYRLETPPIVDTLSFRVFAGGRVSAPALVTPVDPPRSVAFNFRTTPPAYTGLPAKTEESLKGDISALPGTTVEVGLRANNALEGATFIAPDGTLTHLKVAGSEARGASFTVSGKAGYGILLRDAFGYESSETERYDINLLQDEPPDVALVEPADRVDVPGDLVLRLSGFAADDYGLTEASLVYEFDYDSIPRSIALFPVANTAEIALLPTAATGVMAATGSAQGRNGTRFDFALNWDLVSLNLLPGDELTYWVEAADNDNISGPHISKSRAKRLRYPSLTEIQDEMTGVENKVLEGMENVYERTEDLTKRVEEIQTNLNEKRKRGEEATWEDAKALEDAKKEYQDIEKQLKEIAQNAEKVQQKAAEQPSFSVETIQKIQKIGELMDQLLNDEMKKTIAALQQALDQINQQRDLSRVKLEFDAKEFEEQMDRQVALLEDAYFERQFETLEQQADKLLEDMKNQEELTQKSQEETGLDDETLAQRQEELNKQAEDLLKQMDSMAERFNESKPEEAEALREMAETAREEGLEEAMKQAEEKLSQGDRQEAQKQQQSASQCMSKMSGKMKEMGESMMGGGALEIDLARVRRLFDRMLDLATRQEDHVNTLTAIESLLDWGGLDKKRELGQMQSLYADESRRVDTEAGELAKENPFFNFDIIGHVRLAESNMRQALTLSVDGEPRMVRHQSGLAMKHLNIASALLLDTMEQLQNMAAQSSEGSGGMFDALQQMIDQQGNLNQTTQSMKQRLQQSLSAQERMSLQQQIQRMADEQAMIRQEMQKFMQEYGQAPEEQVRDVAQQLEGVGEAMEEAERLIQQRNIDEKLENKQDEILTRLLDAEKSANEQGFEKERKAEPGKEGYEKRKPDELADHTEEIKNRIIEARGGAGEEFVLPSYRTRVREYFRKLSEKALESL